MSQREVVLHEAYVVVDVLHVFVDIEVADVGDGVADGVVEVVDDVIENACGGITGRSPEVARRLLGLFNWESLPEKDEEGDKAEEGSQSEPP